MYVDSLRVSHARRTQITERTLTRMHTVFVLPITIVRWTTYLPQLFSCDFLFLILSEEISLRKSMVKKETRIIKNYSNNAYLQEQGNYEPKTETNKPYKTARSPFLFPTKGSGQWPITRVKLTLRVRKMQVTFHCNIRYSAAVGLKSNRSCQLLQNCVFTIYWIVQQVPWNKIKNIHENKQGILLAWTCYKWDGNRYSLRWQWIYPNGMGEKRRGGWWNNFYHTKASFRWSWSSRGFKRDKYFSQEHSESFLHVTNFWVQFFFHVFPEYQSCKEHIF